MQASKGLLVLLHIIHWWPALNTGTSAHVAVAAVRPPATVFIPAPNTVARLNEAANTIHQHGPLCRATSSASAGTQLQAGRSQAFVANLRVHELCACRRHTVCMHVQLVRRNKHAPWAH